MNINTITQVLASTEVVAGGMDKVLEGVADAINFSGTILTSLIENPIYLFLLASGFVGIGCSIFSKLRRAATPS